MIEVFVYALAVMYSPGPINLLGLNAGFHRQARASLGFFAGVGVAMLILLLAFGLLGSALVSGRNLVVVSALGCAYIAWLSVKIARATVTLEEPASAAPTLRFRNGLWMQLVNPKAMVATLPIATIQFPAAGIDGGELVFWSTVLAAMAVGAPGSYAILGELLGRRVRRPALFRWFTVAMAALLLYVAVSIGYEYVFLPLVKGV